MSAGFCTYVHSDGMSLSVQCTAVAIGQPFVLLHVAEQAHIYIRCARIVLLYEIVPALLALDKQISVGLFGATAVGAQPIHKVVAVLCACSTLVVVAHALVVSAVAMLSARAEHLLVGAVKRGSSVAVQCLVEADRALVSVQTIAESARGEAFAACHIEPAHVVHREFRGRGQVTVGGRSVAAHRFPCAATHDDTVFLRYPHVLLVALPPLAGTVHEASSHYIRAFVRVGTAYETAHALRSVLLGDASRHLAKVHLAVGHHGGGVRADECAGSPTGQNLDSTREGTAVELE